MLSRKKRRCKVRSFVLIEEELTLIEVAKIMDTAIVEEVILDLVPVGKLISEGGSVGAERVIGGFDRAVAPADRTTLKPGGDGKVRL